MCIPEAGGIVESVPLLDTGEAWELDLDGIDAALAAGARAVLLCNPHNPTGTVHSRDALARLAEIARRHDAVVVSDEIHAPLGHPGQVVTPFLDASEDAREVGYAVTSASKAFNLAGLKCALMIAASDGTRAVVRGLFPEIEWRTGLFGAIASVAAFAPESDDWLDSLLLTLDRNRRLIADLLTEQLPERTIASRTLDSWRGSTSARTAGATTPRARFSRGRRWPSTTDRCSEPKAWASLG